VSIWKRGLGKTGTEVTIVGLGGEGILRTYGYDKETYELINKAIDLGITYLESARAYSGSESYYGKALRERRKDIFLNPSVGGSFSRKATVTLAGKVLWSTQKNILHCYMQEGCAKKIDLIPLSFFVCRSTLCEAK
jgi:aryl-alcohol dehydrogenase-like predicted oxidoreductase